MMEENNNVFLAGGDALVYLARHLFGAIHLVHTYLMRDFSTLPFSCRHMYAFRVTSFLRT